MEYKSRLLDLIQLVYSYGNRIDIFCDIYKIEAQRYEKDKFCNYEERSLYSLSYTSTRKSRNLPFILQLTGPMARLIRRALNDNDKHVKLLSPADILLFIRTMEETPYDPTQPYDCAPQRFYYSMIIEVTSDVGHCWEGLILYPNEVDKMIKCFKDAVALTRR